MDFSKFIDEDFDVKDWVNSAFELNKEETNEHYATTMIMKIQMFIQEVNNVIDESCQQEVKNISRTLGDIDAVYQESSLLNEQMNIVRQDIEKVNKNTSKSMQTLVELDKLKSLMKTTSDALQEADNWTTLSADVEEVFETKDVNLIAEKLIGMQQSLTILVDVPDYSDRCQYLENLKNRLETMASTQIVEAFNTQSSDAAQVYMRIFSKIQRESQLIKYYNICQKDKLLPIWKATCDKYCEDTIVESLSEYYDILLSTFHTQVQWCKHIFPDSATVVCVVLSDVLTAIQPTLREDLDKYHRMNQEEGELNQLDNLINLKQISERFIKSIRKAILGYAQTDKAGEEDALYKLGVAVFTPYKTYINQYEQYEIAILMDVLQKIPWHHEDPTDNSELLNTSVTVLFDAAKQAYDRCVQFTNAAALDSLLKCLQTYFEQHIRQYKEIINGMKNKQHGEQITVDTLDWTWFQYALKIIETAGELILQIDVLDQLLVTNIVKYLGKLSTQSNLASLDIKSVNHSILVDEFPALLLVEEKEIQHLAILTEELKSGESVLMSVKGQLHQLSVLAHEFAFNIVFAPLKMQLEDIATMDVWTQQSAGGAITANLPTFSITPLEYITKIGQYLMTLPQQLEPFSTEDNPALIAAVKHGKLPYITEQDNLGQISEIWLESVALRTMDHYGEKVLQIPSLSTHATKQLIIDLEYFCNVLGDLGFSPSTNITNIILLLKATEEQFTEVSTDKPQRMIGAIKKMRLLKTGV